MKVMERERERERKGKGQPQIRSGPAAPSTKPALKGEGGVTPLLIAR